MFTFERVEKKYLIRPNQMEQLLHMAKGRLALDQYGEHTIANLYYDTQKDECIRWSIEKPGYKEKLRIRGYNVDRRNPDVFVELKKKAGGIVYKRRIATDYHDALKLCAGAQSEQANQIRREIEYFVQFYQPTPKLHLAYDRQAYYGTQEDLRITFDQRIRFRTERLSLNGSALDEIILPSSEVLMEIKVNGAIPFWLTRILSILEIYPTSYSKAGNIYKELQARKQTKERNSCSQVFSAAHQET